MTLTAVRNLTIILIISALFTGCFGWNVVKEVAEEMDEPLIAATTRALIDEGYCVPNDIRYKIIPAMDRIRDKLYTNVQYTGNDLLVMIEGMKGLYRGKTTVERFIKDLVIDVLVISVQELGFMDVPLKDANLNKAREYLDTACLYLNIISEVAYEENGWCK